MHRLPERLARREYNALFQDLLRAGVRISYNQLRRMAPLTTRIIDEFSSGFPSRYSHPINPRNHPRNRYF